MNKHLRALLAAVAIVASSSGVCAEMYGSLTSPPGVYFGSGNPNGNFNIDRNNGLELGLRAKNRTPVGPVLIDGSNGVYSVPGGLCTSGCGSAKAKWNYEFSIHTTNGAPLSNYVFRLGVDHDAGVGTDFDYIDPVTYWAFPPSAKDGLVGVQDSQNITFGNTPGGSISANAAGRYDFILLAYALDDPLFERALAQVDISVEVPEPASMALFGLGLASLAAIGRRKLKQA